MWLNHPQGCLASDGTQGKVHRLRHGNEPGDPVFDKASAMLAEAPTCSFTTPNTPEEYAARKQGWGTQPLARKPSHRHGKRRQRIILSTSDPPFRLLHRRRGHAGREHYPNSAQRLRGWR